MFSSNLVQSIVAVLSLSAAAVAQIDQPIFYHDTNYSGPSQTFENGLCASFTNSELNHHLGSIHVPDGSGYKCSLYFNLSCGVGENAGGPICVTDRSLPDLLTLEGNPCANAMEFGVGYGVESVYCYRE